MTNVLSPLAGKIMNANPHAYEKLVVDSGTPALARELLDGVQLEQLLEGPAKSPAAADALLAGLWLWHDGLEESHRISQSIHSSTGSFWHAIMHRREGDFSNSKYWYARTTGHPAFQTLAGRAGPIINQAPAEKMLLKLVSGGWNPNIFVDLVESASDQPDDPLYATAVSLQQLEWRALWDYCVAPG
jgi:hypothetical protein